MNRIKVDGAADKYIFSRSVCVLFYSGSSNL